MCFTNMAPRQVASWASCAGEVASQAWPRVKKDAGDTEAVVKSVLSLETYDQFFLLRSKH